MDLKPAFEIRELLLTMTPDYLTEKLLLILFLICLQLCKYGANGSKKNEQTDVNALQSHYTPSSECIDILQHNEGSIKTTETDHRNFEPQSGDNDGTPKLALHSLNLHNTQYENFELSPI
ncbi:hypothetical protein TNCV_1730701 [Trichonephila clavipes]|nr:hypothetical protein TNCV_1730701 [Trichonephila clavipes]